MQGRVRLYSNLNLPAWGLLPYFALPSRGIDLVVGKEVTIYGDTLINVPIVNNLNVTYTCDIGTQVGNNLVVSPVVGNIGDHVLTITFKQGSLLITQVTTKIVVNPLAVTGDSKVLMIGDSILYLGCTQFDTAINGTLAPTITFVGSLGTTVKHDGISGIGIATILTDPKSNPPNHFIKSSAFNMPAYFVDNSIETPDYVLIRLGVNDMYGQSLTLNATYNGELTDAEQTALINNSKTFVDALLAYDSNLKIIIGLPTICENSGAGWNASYDETTYIQDSYIRNIHKLWLALITAYDNDTYNPRVSISNEAIFLDRNDGYQKTNGIHTDGVHPSTSGLTQIGDGMALALNHKLLIPSSLATAWENDYATIDFTDKTGGLAEHEVYESKNGGAYTLVTTLAAGVTHYHNSTWQNASMNFKVRVKIGSWYSEYSSIVNLVTPLVVKTDQSTLTNFVFNYLFIAAGKTVNVDWGDSTNNNYTGNNTAITKTYSATANPYYIKLSGDVNSIQWLYNTSQVKSYGDLGKWILPTRLAKLGLNACQFTGNVSGWVFGSVFETIAITQATGYGFTGDISSWSFPSTTTSIQIAGSTNKLSGNLNGWNLSVNAATFRINGNLFTGLPRGSFKQFANGTEYYCVNNSCNSAEIDALLVYMDNYFTTNTPIKNSRFYINGTGMGIPSATGLAAKTSILGKYTTAGYTAIIDVNS